MRPTMATGRLYWGTERGPSTKIQHLPPFSHHLMPFHSPRTTAGARDACSTCVWPCGMRENASPKDVAGVGANMCLGEPIWGEFSGSWHKFEPTMSQTSESFTTDRTTMRGGAWGRRLRPTMATGRWSWGTERVPSIKIQHLPPISHHLMPFHSPRTTAGARDACSTCAWPCGMRENASPNDVAGVGATLCIAEPI